MNTPAPIQRLALEERLAGAVVHGNTLYLAGQVADNPDLDIEGQTADILAQIDALLASRGVDKTHLLSVQIFIADINEIDRMNTAWDRWLDQDHKPARATVEAKLADPRWRVEMTAIAALG